MRDNSKSLSVIFRDDAGEINMKGINCIKRTEDALFTGSRDGVVRMYHPETLELKKMLNNHTHWVNDIEIVGNYLYSGSADARVLVWNLESDDNKPIHSLLIHKDYIHSLKYFQDHLYSAGEDGVIVKTDLDYKSYKFTAFPISIWDIDGVGSILGVVSSSKVISI